MTRFIALAWDDRNVASVQYTLAVRQLVGSRNWATVTDGAGLAVFLHPSSPTDENAVSLDHDAGVIIGTLFNRSADSLGISPRKTHIDAQQTAELIRTHGRSLMERDWGAYLLFLRFPARRTVSVFRAPVGMLPCYYRCVEGCTLLVSCPGDFLWLGCGAFSINWDCIRAQAAAGDYLARETGLSELTALVSGDCLDICEGQVSIHSYWRPFSNRPHPLRGFSEAVELMQSETHRCVRTWASLHNTILLLLSGGLDSSIVLACLTASRGPQVLAVTFYSEGAGDERAYARSMAQITGTCLDERASDPHIDLRNSLRCALTPNPALNFSAFQVEPLMQQLAQRCNATAIFTGEVGDDVFGHAAGPEALAEILQRGVSVRRFLAASMDFAELTRVSLWRAMRSAWAYRRWLSGIGTWSVYHHRRFVGHRRENFLIDDEAAHLNEGASHRFVHPWLSETEEMPYGKATLIYSVAQATSCGCHSPFSEAGDAVSMSPLVSQPLFEAVLRIPSDMHFLQAQNGAVARAAFSSILSSDVLDRGIGKGTPAIWARQLVEHNTAFLKELLLDGLLVQHRILDRVKVETILSKQISRTRVGIADVLRQIYIEAWLRRWIHEGARP